MDLNFNEYWNSTIFNMANIFQSIVWFENEIIQKT